MIILEWAWSWLAGSENGGEEMRAMVWHQEIWSLRDGKEDRGVMGERWGRGGGGEEKKKTSSKWKWWGAHSWNSQDLVVLDRVLF